MASSRDVAALAGVSQATVSRVLAGSERVAEATRQKVLEAMAELSYVPHQGARIMRTQRTSTVGVVVSDLQNPFYGELLDELTVTFDRLGYRVVIWNSPGTGHRDALAAIRERAIDGVVFTTATEESVELAAALELGSPLVLINRVIDTVDCDRVVSDNAAGGASVADFLVENGRADAALISGLETSSTSRQRARGFLERMEQLGKPLPGHRLRGGCFDYGVAFEQATALVTAPEPVRAIFCVNDLMAFAAQDALREQGLQPGRECWIVGYDDVAMASWASYSLTTVRQPSREMARAGAELLVERLHNPSAPPKEIRFAQELVVRASAPGAPATPG